MTFKTLAFLALVLPKLCFAGYFADQNIQKLAPEAFALQPESLAFHKQLDAHATHEREAFIDLINENPELREQIENFKNLSWDEKELVLRRVFDLEVKALKIKAPELIIDSNSIEGEAFFEFDVDHPTPGKVFINPEAIQKDSNPYTALMLLIHETRHSAQFQLAFLSGNSDNPEALAYKAAFIAQKKFAKDITGFCDFLTLNNEYEAFQFGNYVVHSLTAGSVNTLGMGTFASQYNDDLTLKINLLELFNVHNGQDVLKAFNSLEKAQYDILVKQ